MCENTTKNFNKIMNNLYYICELDKNKDNHFEKIASYLNEDMPNDKVFYNALIEKDLYSKNICKFILGSVENNNKEKINLKDFTIEHVLPQNKNSK
ncbi:UNVERIFIED_CONTAM: DUF1524 domain-containing protein [Campylobacter lari]